MEAAIKYSKKLVHTFNPLWYTISPVHTTESFLKVAETLVEMGTDSLCIKDMSGLLGPADAYDLVSTFKNVLANCQSTCIAISLAVLLVLHTGKLLKLT